MKWYNVTMDMSTEAEEWLQDECDKVEEEESEQWEEEDDLEILF